MKTWLKTLFVMGFLLFAGPTVAFWFCPSMPSWQAEKNYSQIPSSFNPRRFREAATAAHPPIYRADFSESQSPMPSPLERLGPQGMQPPKPYPAYPMGPAQDIRIEQGSDAENYYLTIFVTGYQPEDIGVTIDHGSLLIYSIRSEETRHQTEGFFQHMTRFRRFSRRISLPRDADPSGLIRTNAAGTVEVVIPRLR